MKDMSTKKCIKCGSFRPTYIDYKQAGTAGLTITIERCRDCDAEQPRTKLTPMQKAFLH
jgi:hypothetical protein